MNSTNKKAPGARGVPQPFKQQTGHMPQFKPVVVQPKTGVSTQSVKRPVAPPVYRPQQVPKVLQTKSSAAHSPQSGQAPRQPVAPQVYRPEAKKIVQPKVISSPRPSPTAPPVYRSEQKRIVQPKMATAAQAHTPPKATPVHRPQAKPLIPATRPVQMKAQAVAPTVSRAQSVQPKADRRGTQAAASSKSPSSSSASIQLKRAFGVVQMKPCYTHGVEGCPLCKLGVGKMKPCHAHAEVGCPLCKLGGMLEGAEGDEFAHRIYSFLPDNDIGRLAMTSTGTANIADRQKIRRMEKEPFKVGVYSGVYESGLGRNWADLHVTGELGGSLDINDLIGILKHLYQKMKVCHEETGVCGVLEWHPTGAVVTKQVVELLASALGGSFGCAIALGHKKWRKFIEGGTKRDKLAERMDKDILDEYFAFLNCLKGAQGVTIIGVLTIKPPNIHSLSPTKQLSAIEQNMLEETPQGEERFSTYVKEYSNFEGRVPSIQVRIQYYLIPVLIQTVMNHKQ